MGYSPWDHKESDVTECLTLSLASPAFQGKRTKQADKKKFGRGIE